MSKEERTLKIKECFKDYVDFPKKGIIFKDIFCLTSNAVLFADCISLLVEHIIDHHPDVEVIVGLEARGFLFGPSIALQLQVPFVPVRKAGKLPGELVKASYNLEYGTDTVEIQKDALKVGQKVIVVDDLLATGGTMKATCELMNKVNVKVIECLVIIELLELAGRKLIPTDVYSLVAF